jgi:hypothetical protein
VLGHRDAVGGNGLRNNDHVLCVARHDLTDPRARAARGRHPKRSAALAAGFRLLYPVKSFRLEGPLTDRIAAAPVGPSPAPPPRPSGTSAQANDRRRESEYALLLFLYNTGARVSEATQMKVGNLQIGRRAVPSQLFLSLLARSFQIPFRFSYISIHSSPPQSPTLLGSRQCLPSSWMTIAARE